MNYGRNQINRLDSLSYVSLIGEYKKTVKQLLNGLFSVSYNTLTPFKEYAVFLGCSTWKSSTTGDSELIPGA